MRSPNAAGLWDIVGTLGCCELTEHISTISMPTNEFDKLDRCQNDWNRVIDFMVKGGHKAAIWDNIVLVQMLFFYFKSVRWTRITDIRFTNSKPVIHLIGQVLALSNTIHEKAFEFQL